MAAVASRQDGPCPAGRLLLGSARAVSWGPFPGKNSKPLPVFNPRRYLPSTSPARAVGCSGSSHSCAFNPRRSQVFLWPCLGSSAPCLSTQRPPRKPTSFDGDKRNHSAYLRGFFLICNFLLQLTGRCYTRVIACSLLVKTGNTASNSSIRFTADTAYTGVKLDFLSTRRATS